MRGASGLVAQQASETGHLDRFPCESLPFHGQRQTPDQEPDPDANVKRRSGGGHEERISRWTLARVSCSSVQLLGQCFAEAQPT